jgi:hypothetical protein
MADFASNHQNITLEGDARSAYGESLAASESQTDSDILRKDAVHHQLSSTDSSLKDLLIDDASGSLFDSISWLLMNSGSLDFTDNQDSSIFVSMKASSDALEQSLLSSSMQALINQDVAVSSNWHSWSFDQIAHANNLAVNSFTEPRDFKEVAVTRDMIPRDDDDDDDDSDAGFNDSDSKSSGRKRAGSPLDRNGDAPKKKRQRQKLQDLEDKAKMLMAENSELRSHLSDLSTRAVDMERQKTEMMNMMVDRLARGDNGSPELVGMLRKYGELFAEYGTCRQKEVSFHLSQLKRLMLPTQTTKMCMFTLQQDKSFYQSSKSPLWNILSNELGMTSEQAAKIQTHRYSVHNLDW